MPEPADYIDLYCERCGPGLWAEPLNATTNIAYLAAAAIAWWMARRRGGLDLGIAGLIALATAVGIGSALFHTFATVWAKWLDLVPIILYQLWFLALYVRQVVGLRVDATAATVGGFLAAAVGALQLPPVLNGSLFYLPPILMLLACGMHHQWRRLPGRGLLLGAAPLFLVALVFRTIDAAVCPYFPIGTHFLWHLLTGGLLLLTMLGLIATPRPALGK